MHSDGISDVIDKNDAVFTRSRRAQAAVGRHGGGGSGGGSGEGSDEGFGGGSGGSGGSGGGGSGGSGEGGAVSAVVGRNEALGFDDVTAETIGFMAKSKWFGKKF